jgi:hypothetical protein
MPATEGLQAPDGTPIDLAEANKEFAEAMAATPGEVTDAPPKHKPENPVAAPKRPRGRPRKDDRARVSAGSTAPPKADPEADARRGDGVRGLVQMAAGLCLVADSRTPDKNIAFRADAVTLAASSDALATACVETAKHSASFAAALDKVTQAGPYAALISVTLGLGAQLARNHGVKAGEMLGAKSPEDVLAALEAEDDERTPAAA